MPEHTIVEELLLVRLELARRRFHGADADELVAARQEYALALRQYNDFAVKDVIPELFVLQEDVAPTVEGAAVQLVFADA
jgi:hypothetical protein